MFEYLCLDFSKSNQEIKNLKKEIELLKIDLLNNEKYLSMMGSKYHDVPLTNQNSTVKKTLLRFLLKNVKVLLKIGFTLILIPPKLLMIRFQISVKKLLEDILMKL